MKSFRNNKERKVKDKKGKEVKDDEKNKINIQIDDSGESKPDGNGISVDDKIVVDEIKAIMEKNNSLEKEVHELKDSLLRRAAEFENYKRRTEVYQSELLKYAAEGFIKKVLDVLDDFERSLIHIKDAKDVNAIKSGLQLVYDKFNKILEEQGVKKIETKGREFDFNLHEALLQQPAPGVPPHTIIEEVQSGYMYKDKIIRHAKVIVSMENDEASNDSQAGNN